MDGSTASSAAATEMRRLNDTAAVAAAALPNPFITACAADARTDCHQFQQAVA